MSDSRASTGAPLQIELFAGWLANGERGLSSEAIVEHLTGTAVGGKMYAPIRGRGDVPWDLGDFRRCELLLRRVNLARVLLPSMAAVSPAWARFAERWADIVALAESERPDVFTDRPGLMRAPKTYALIYDTAYAS